MIRMIDIDVTSTVAELSVSILNTLNDPNVGGAHLKSMDMTWSESPGPTSKLLVSDFLGLDSQMIALTQPLEIDPKKMGYNSCSTKIRRTIRVVKWIPVDTKATPPPPPPPPPPTQEATQRRGSIDPSDPDFEKQPNRRRSRASVIYAGAQPAVDDNEGDDVDGENKTDSMNDYQKPLTSHKSLHYLVCVDGSEVSHTAFTAARALMTRQNGDAIEVLHVSDRSKSYLPFDLEPDYIRRQYEMELLDVANNQKTITTLNKTVGYDDTPISTKDFICKYANDTTFPDGIDNVPTHQKPDLLVIGLVGRKGPKLNPTIFGSAADYSMRKVRCSSLIVKTKIPARGASGLKPRVFVVAVDGSRSSHQAFLKTLQLCDRQRDAVTVVYFFDGRVAILE